MKIIFIVLLITIITGCGEHNSSTVETNTGDILANELIQTDPSADFFILNDRVYVRNKEVKNGQDDLGESLGKIESHYIKEGEFNHLMSTKLPLGTEIYRIKNENSVDQVIVKVNDRLVIYKALPEG
ncbi:hypothetical protein [Paenibacillus aceti]|uniref:DUF3221 domain-containing protein n=1 Tax=Paenibacillus aceti TaxID=1820010 RepID=A0ABQ1W4I0_9BACL|nr:hypothetical protein [Paenibacillus aceti]GGG12509.1 hypothetical protein GCM10010913_37860 [Paenibacillus aceti]